MKTVMKVMKGSKALSLFTFTLVSVAMAGLMSGCGKSSDNNNPVNPLVGPYGYGAACTTCGAMTQPFVNTYGEDRYPEALALQLFSSVTPNAAPQYQTTQQIAAQGTFIIPNGDANCGVAPGTYQLTTVQPGSYNGSQTVTNLVLQAVNAPQLTIVIQNAYISLGSSFGQLDGQPHQSRLLATGYINTPQCAFRLN